jgi:hypothetical protein
MLYILKLCFLAMALFDAWATNQRLSKVGIQAEYNPLIRWLSEHFGTEGGVFIGILVPTLILISFAEIFPKSFIFLVGTRTTLFGFQMRTLKELLGRQS